MENRPRSVLNNSHHPSKTAAPTQHPAPTVRPTVAQRNALGIHPTKTPSPERAT